MTKTASGFSIGRKYIGLAGVSFNMSCLLLNSFLSFAVNSTQCTLKWQMFIDYTQGNKPFKKKISLNIFSHEDNKRNDMYG